MFGVPGGKMAYDITTLLDHFLTIFLVGLAVSFLIRHLWGKRYNAKRVQSLSCRDSGGCASCPINEGLHARECDKKQ